MWFWAAPRATWPGAGHRFGVVFFYVGKRKMGKKKSEESREGGMFYDAL